MTAVVQQRLDSFDALPESDKHQAAMEIFHRYGGTVQGALPDEALVVAAEALSCELDAEEAGHAAP